MKDHSVKSGLFILESDEKHGMKVFVETERLILREIIIEDVPDFFELDSDPEVHRYLGNKPVTTIEQSEKAVNGILNQYRENGVGRWAIVDKNTNEFLGWSGLKYEQVLRKEFNYYDLGYRLKKKHWGKGIATEAAIASLDYGFKNMALEEICAAADVDNGASNAILKKLGMAFTETFVFEGTECNWYVLRKSDLRK